MVFVVADGDEDWSERTVFLSSDSPTEDLLREALLTANPIHYGTHFILDDSGSQKIVGVCTSGPTVEAHEPGEFLLYVDGALVAERASRHAVLEKFVGILGK